MWLRGSVWLRNFKSYSQVASLEILWNYGATRSHGATLVKITILIINKKTIWKINKINILKINKIIIWITKKIIIWITNKYKRIVFESFWYRYKSLFSNIIRKNLFCMFSSTDIFFSYYIREKYPNITRKISIWNEHSANIPRTYRERSAEPSADLKTRA